MQALNVEVIKMTKCPYLNYLSKPYDFQGDDKPLHSDCVITKQHCDNYFGNNCKVLEQKVEEISKKYEQ